MNPRECLAAQPQNNLLLAPLGVRRRLGDEDREQSPAACKELATTLLLMRHRGQTGVLGQCDTWLQSTTPAGTRGGLP